MSIRVFISHSTCRKDGLDQKLQDLVPAHAAFRRQLCERLKQEPGIDVVVDEDMPPASFWREFLFERIADCNAAIVLVNEQALRHSPWVDTEVKVLGYRAHHEKDYFRLIIVPFGGIKGADIDKHPGWEPVALSELQMLPHDELDITNAKKVDGVIRQIISTLRELPEVVEDNTSSGWLVNRLCALLEMEPPHLLEIGKRLGADTAGICNPSTLRRRVAHALYREGPMALHKLVKYPYCKLKVDEWRDIFEILCTYWVDMSASIGILACCPQTAVYRVIAINGKQVAYTPRAYVRQVCGENYPWPVVAVKPTYDVVSQIRETLIKDYFGYQLHSILPNLDWASEAEKTDGLNQLLDTTPVFVALFQERGGQVDDVIADISGVFPNIRIIVCTGTEKGETPVLENIHMLKPELDLADEAKAYDDFRKVGGRIR